MHVIPVISGKGGVGKTTTVANVAVALASFKRRVLAIDGNFSTPNLAYHFGIFNSSPGIQAVLEGKLELQKAVVLHPSGAEIVPSSVPPSKGEYGRSAWKNVVNSADHDFVLIDCAPGVNRDVMSILEASNSVITVTNPEVPAVTDAVSAMKVVEEMGIKCRSVELNRVRKKKYELSVDEIESLCNFKIDAIIPESNEVRKSISVGLPVVAFSPSSPAAIAFKKLAADLCGVDYRPSLMERILWYLGIGRGKVRNESLLAESLKPLMQQKTRNEVEDVLRMLEILKKYYTSGVLSRKTYEELRGVYEERIRKFTHSSRTE